MDKTLLILGLGYCGRAVAAQAAGFAVSGTVRDPDAHAADGLDRIAFDAAAPAIARATHLLVSLPPKDGVDPALCFRDALMAAPNLRWIGYYSTTGVYGDAQGARVNETTTPDPCGPRGQARLAAEAFWQEVASRHAIPLDIMRIGGIYGPGRSAFDALRAGTARRTVAPGHVFSRIHRDDIAQATLAAMATATQGTRILNLVDDEPSPSYVVTEYASALLGVAPPAAHTLEEAWPTMSPMARSFWADRRVVDNTRTKAALGLDWIYPNCRDGLTALLRQESVAGASEAAPGLGATNDRS
ncbi:Rossmann-fold NAD(P)-binding domain-containing protein [Tanticharoenia sakaeratensis]|uniref:Nucleoside-diphosphate-sugar epimerases n=1 Tax=Tanticharoenia sakaeratensis NBRC 103193 TaxID=1231623 RepID=A0A0D6MIQ4_9PROT|nr:hypothetical protein [Tanticharoenia sakaeratensis]GAN53507.1 nucleoside-diphosphate-sugar epimerases [Tanticharoenia sakaeratensis NBRC 103193]GBQ17705.1 nucleoside-diphosphate-sugar epimerase [Tanticharoenia sakaeratensis NBRC 103193]